MQLLFQTIVYYWLSVKTLINMKILPSSLLPRRLIIICNYIYMSFEGPYSKILLCALLLIFVIQIALESYFSFFFKGTYQETVKYKLFNTTQVITFHKHAHCTTDFKLSLGRVKCTHYLLTSI